jgi:hypothetical protein
MRMMIVRRDLLFAITLRARKRPNANANSDVTQNTEHERVSGDDNKRIFVASLEPISGP